MTAPASHIHQLGEESSRLVQADARCSRGPNNPLTILMQMAERYGGVIPVNMGNQRIVLLTEPEHFKRVLVTKADDYIKYFDGLKPIFGKSMITHDGALWQKIRMPQQPAFHPDMFAEYIPYFLAAIRTKMDIWAKLAQTGETVEMVEQTWTLAADMICKALFDRDMPFNPHFVFKCVKTYTDVMNHKSIRLKKVAGEEFEITEEDAAKAMEVWAGVPPEVFAADPREERERTLLKMIEAAVADPVDPRVRPAAGRRRAQAVPVGRHRDDGADAGLGALRDRASIPRPPSASAARARRSTATASRRRPTIPRSPTRAPSSRRPCGSIRRSGC